jgi:hypothetical protein
VKSLSSFTGEGDGVATAEDDGLGVANADGEEVGEDVAAATTGSGSTPPLSHAESTDKAMTAARAADT